MKAIQVQKTGGFEVLVPAELPLPRPKPKEAVVKVSAAGVNFIDALVNNAGTYLSKHFTDHTVEDLRSLVFVNIEGFFFISQLPIKQMLAQKTGGSIVNITSTLVDRPIAGINSAVPMITKGGLEGVT
jgi:NADP-dependent 3-hydroxy acid dehydrogenase YdfG